MKTVFALLLLGAALGIQTTYERQRVVDTVNQANTTWTATVYPRFAAHDYSLTRKMCGVLPGGPKLPRKTHEANVALPTAFDTRDMVPACKDIVNEVRDQSTCGSCWSEGAAEAFTDRICIQSKGKVTDRIGAEDLFTCCGFECGNGCDGGYPSAAWSWFQETGCVTGGANDAPKGEWCNRYYFPKCDHHTTGKYKPCGSSQPTPNCVKQCDAGYAISYEQDKHFVSDAYSVEGESDLMQELYKNGPIEVSFTVYADFEAYKGGVYQHTTGEELGGHAVEMVGWGEETDGTKWWLIKNSWNTDWGEKGYFRIIRGTNDCGIEGSGAAGTPKL